MDPKILEHLKAAAEGYLYPSETDAPVEPFHWEAAVPSLSVERVRALTGHDADTPIEEEGLDEFLAPLLGDRTLADRGRALKEVLERSLGEIRVFRLGRTSKEVFVVGKTRGGDWAGVRTRVVET